MKNIKSTIACILSLLIMTGGMVTAPVSSETAPAFNSVKLDGDVREALENGATTLYILADVNVSAEHYEQLHAHQQATVAFKHSTRDKQDALGDQMFEAQKQLEKGEITQEAYDALCQELQPQIDALDEAYLKELDALDQETKEIALSEYESKLSQWGDEGNILYAGELSSLCRYIIKGELTTEQIINLINDEDVGYIYLPVDLSEWTTPTESTGTDETPPVEVPEESLYEVWEIGIGDVTLTPGKSYTYSATVFARNGAKFRVKEPSFVKVGKMSPDDPPCVYSQIEWNIQVNEDQTKLKVNITVTGGDTGKEMVSLSIPKDMGISVIQANGTPTDLNGIVINSLGVEVVPDSTEPITEPTELITDPTEPTSEPSEGPTEPPTPEHSLFGDFNHDGEVNASDAAIMLIYAAEHGAGTFSGSFEEYVSK